MIVDAAVYPLVPDDEYRDRLPRPWRDAMGLVPPPFGKLYEAPFADVADPARGGDPDAMADAVFGEQAVDAAVLSPLTRGLLPNPQHLTAVARATNEWLHERWLQSEQRWFGSIRLPVTDPVASVMEIERWASDARFVQVVVPLRVHEQYGGERYFPIWKAAAAHGFPVYVLDDLASAAELVRSPVGQPVSFAENDALRPLLSIVHLASLVVSGTFSRLPGLQFVFGDGGADLATPLLWRLDKDWRSGRVEVPWVTEAPSTIARRHAGFVTQGQDGRPDGEHPDAALARVSQAETQLLYGSRRPYWDAVTPADACAPLPASARPRVLGRNAVDRMPRLASPSTGEPDT
ncbi:MAG TPA: amidohydrolase family protein [Solirubrobacteraceae bacterium]|nr:amidohydrolase family protein [Solirubrobacteraceae bacterium]